MLPPGRSKLYLWQDPLLDWQLQWQVAGESRTDWITVEVSTVDGWVT